MRARRKTGHNLGEAVSLEAAITIMTIIFVLRMLFLVPLVSIDKARLEKKTVDHFWGDLVSWLTTDQSGESPNAISYQEAFDLFSSSFIHATDRDEDSHSVRYVESLTHDSSLIVVRHDLTNNLFSAMVMSKNGETTTYRHGKLSKVSGSSSWFAAQEDSPDYGDDSRSKVINSVYRAWRSDCVKGLK